MVKDEGMDLQSFIKSTLVQIVRGVADAIEELETVGGGTAINPSPTHVNYASPNEIGFDVAVTVTEGKSGSGSARLKVMGLDMGGGKDSSVSTEAISRVRFAVPVAAPSTKIDRMTPSGDRPRFASGTGSVKLAPKLAP